MPKAQLGRNDMTSIRAALVEGNLDHRTAREAVNTAKVEVASAVAQLRHSYQRGEKPMIEYLLEDRSLWTPENRKAYSK